MALNRVPPFARAAAFRRAAWACRNFSDLDRSSAGSCRACTSFAIAALIAAGLIHRAGRCGAAPYARGAFSLFITLFALGRFVLGACGCAAQLDCPFG
jgi:hypothetical protein